MATSAAITRPPISSDEALRIARLDAEKAYRDLSAYQISLALESDGWHVDYRLKDETSTAAGRTT